MDTFTSKHFDGDSCVPTRGKEGLSFVAKSLVEGRG